MATYGSTNGYTVIVGSTNSEAETQATIAYVDVLCGSQVL